MSIEKKMTAFIIPNAIGISTLHSSFFFTSFVSREQTYSKLIMFWKNALADQPLTAEELIKGKSFTIRPRTVEQSEESKEKRLRDQGSGEIEDVDDSIHSCGCEAHLKESVAYISGLDLKLAQHRLFSNDHTFLTTLFSNLGYKGTLLEGLWFVGEHPSIQLDLDMTESKWQESAIGTTTRSICCKMPIPNIISSQNEFLSATFADSLIIYDQESE